MIPDRRPPPRERATFKSTLDDFDPPSRVRPGTWKVLGAAGHNYLPGALLIAAGAFLLVAGGLLTQSLDVVPAASPCAVRGAANLQSAAACGSELAAFRSRAAPTSQTARTREGAYNLFGLGGLCVVLGVLCTLGVRAGGMIGVDPGPLFFLAGLVGLFVWLIFAFALLLASRNLHLDVCGAAEDLACSATYNARAAELFADGRGCPVPQAHAPGEVRCFDAPARFLNLDGCVCLCADAVAPVCAGTTLVVVSLVALVATLAIVIYSAVEATDGSAWLIVVLFLSAVSCCVNWVSCGLCAASEGAAVCDACCC